MFSKRWWKAALSKGDNASTTRICFLATNAFVFVMAIVLAVTGVFTLDWGWFLLGLFTTAWGGKDIAKYMEVKRELGKSSYGRSGRGNSSFGRNLPVAEDDNRGA